MARRPPSRPPEIPGYTHDRLLGSGGFADVFLYHQHMPRREVAVKALLASAVTDDGLEQFTAEANLMAQLSTHPSIVTVFHAATTEDGRPYLVMEYCPRPNLSVRYRNERIGVAEGLRIAVRLAGAVETAHRAGILHRDIKPANVLTTAYGWPALTDFGISVATGTSAAEDTEQAGMSIPWAAPEFFADDAPRGVPADVYALAATIYTLLAARSPFELPGRSNTALDLITRIERDRVPPIGRDDVPASLEAVLARGMAKDPAQRYGSAAEFARAIHQVEQELHLTPTALDIPDTSWMDGPADGDDGEQTRVRSISTVPQRGPVQDDATRLRGVAYAAPEAPSAAEQAPAPADPAVPDPAVPASAAGDGSRLRPRTRTALIASAAAVLVAGTVTVIAYGALNSGTPIDPTEPTTEPITAPTVTTRAAPPPPEGLTLERDGGDVHAAWSVPEYDGELEYAYQVTEGDSAGGLTSVGSTTSVAIEDGADRVCILVVSINEDRQFSDEADSPQECV
ncbi:serine/threonine-protein kinase [Ruania alba]|uniref:non-specific serine/threonine protein kinase n=1 Tax=Ruania alba TaxID=648782 RepID=A0A1H5F5S7_9MICO|nr:serine/threonine-protein kinase [Ruania alba]SED98643.1 Serine/threonine protein kinase [Ruania alba]